MKDPRNSTSTIAESKGQANETHGIQPPSAIDQVMWTRRMAEKQVKLAGHGGRTHRTFRDPVHDNCFADEIRVASSSSAKR